MDKKTLNIIRTSIRAAATLGALVLAAFLLASADFFKVGVAVDNLTGMLPLALMLVFAGSVAAVAWMKHSRRSVPVAAALALVIVLSGALYPTALRGDWWVHVGVNEEASDPGPDLTLYAPFSENSKLAKLSAKPALTLGEDLPVLDGATALYPVYAAFIQAAYDKNVYSEEIHALCTNTRGAYEAVIKGERDIIFVAGASKAQETAAKAAGAELKFTPVGYEAFVFLAGEKNPIDNITTQQIRNIYSGKTAMWSTLGWREGGRIVPYQRPEGSGSQTGLQNIMNGLPIQAPQPMTIPNEVLIGSNSLMRQISMEWNGVQPAIGYSYRYYATTMYANPDAKLLCVDGVRPTPENIRNGRYPYASHFYAVTLGEPTGSSKVLIDWVLSEQGQELIERTGYTPLAGD